MKQLFFLGFFFLSIGTKAQTEITTVTISAPIGSLSSCLGSSSVPTTFGITGEYLTESVTITAPTGFEISTFSDDLYSSSLTLTNTTTLSQTLYIRLNFEASIGVNVGTITATTLGVSDVTSTISGTVLSLPVLSANTITLCKEATYLLTVTTVIPVDDGWRATGAITVSNGTITAGTVTGTYAVNYTDGCGQIASATVNVTSIADAPAITDAKASYKYDGSPKGPASANFFTGYNGFDYSSASQPTEPGYYRANSQVGGSAGCPTLFYIFRCTTCGN